MSDLEFEDLKTGRGQAKQAQCFDYIKHPEGEVSTGFVLLIHKIKNKDTTEDHDANTYFIGLMNNGSEENELLPCTERTVQNIIAAYTGNERETQTLSEKWAFTTNFAPNMVGPLNARQAAAFREFVVNFSNSDHFYQLMARAQDEMGLRMMALGNNAVISRDFAREIL